MKEETTWSPTAKVVTPSPTSTTSPAASCPRISGGGIGMVPFVADRSEWHTPQAATFTVTSPRLGPATLICSTTTGLFSSRQMTAFALYSICPSIAWLKYPLLRRKHARPRQAFHRRPLGRPFHERHDRGPQRRHRRSD